MRKSSGLRSHVGIEICLSRWSSLCSRHLNRTVLARHSVIPAEEFLVGDHHARQVQDFNCRLPRTEKHAHTLKHVTVKVPSFHVVFSCQFRRTDVLEAPRLEIFVQCELRLDAVQRPVWPHRTHFAWLSSLLEPLTHLSNVLRCPINATTHGARVPTRERSIFLLNEVRMRSGQPIKQHRHPLKNDTSAPHDANPAWRKSRSTSHAARVFLSAPTARESSKSERACLFSPPAQQPSVLPRFGPGQLTKILVSSDKRPPTSTPATSNRALLRGPTSSGYLRSFPLLAAARATPSSPEAPCLPSERAEDRGVNGKLGTSKQAAHQLPPQALWHLSCLRSQGPDLAATRWW